MTNTINSKLPGENNIFKLYFSHRLHIKIYTGVTKGHSVNTGIQYKILTARNFY